MLNNLKIHFRYMLHNFYDIIHINYYLPFYNFINKKYINLNHIHNNYQIKYHILSLIFLLFYNTLIFII